MYEIGTKKVTFAPQSGPLLIIDAFVYITPYKWSCKWVTGVIVPTNGVVTLLITGGGVRFTQVPVAFHRCGSLVLLALLCHVFASNGGFISFRPEVLAVFFETTKEAVFFCESFFWICLIQICSFVSEEKGWFHIYIYIYFLNFSPLNLGKDEAILSFDIFSKLGSVQ